MKKVVLFLSLLSMVPCLGQETSVKELKELQQQITKSLDQYDTLTQDEKNKLNASCEIATNLYGYLVAKEVISAADSINVDELCKKIAGIKILATLKVQVKKLKEKEEEFENYLSKLKPSEQEEEFKEATEKITSLKGEMVTECEALHELLDELTENGTVADLEISNLNSTSCADVKPLKTEEGKEAKKFIIVGNNDPIDTDSLFKQRTAREFYREIIGRESKTRLGTFNILPDEAQIDLYLRTKRSKIKGLQNGSEKYVTVSSIFKNKEELGLIVEDTSTSVKDIFKSSYISKVYAETFSVKKQVTINESQQYNTIHFPQRVLFKSIAFETKEGGMVDIRLQTMSPDKKVELYFESEAPVSMLNFTRRAKRSFLVFSNKFNDKTSFEGIDYKYLDQLYIRVSDVIKYFPNEGNNYVPEDIALRLPGDLKAEDTENAPREYELINDSSLSNLLDLRAYSDFLGLFANESNGLFQIQGKADFFLNPFNFNRSSLYLFKKITPFIRYSRLEEDNSFIETSLQGVMQQFENSRLELIEKSNLEFGFDVNLASFRFFKESPIWFSLHIPINVYNTQIQIPTAGDTTTASTDETNISFSTFGAGFAGGIEIRRLSNFGLNLGYAVKNYSGLGNYTGNNIKEPDNFWANSFDAEIFYYPGEDESQSIFIRMRGFREAQSNGAAFQQLQFGYRFTIGLNKVKAKG
ncbi:MAG: hypothetical protein Mars2KO_05180 [Maribacter sp.]